MKTCFLFTLSYPYLIGGEITFIKHELPHLVRNFDKVILFPANIVGEKVKVDKEINIEESFAHFNNLKKHKKIKSQLSALFSKVFIREIINKPSIILSPKKLVSTMLFFSSAISIKLWFKDYLKDSGYLRDTILLYTYWCTSTTMGLGMATKNNKIKLISRAHGIDFYEERGSVFGRNETLKVTNKIYLASFAGREYLIKKYPKYANKIYFAGLGSVNPTFITRQSTDSIFRIVSCSNIDNNKRVNLIAEALNILINQSIFNIEWTHFGDGPNMNDLEQYIATITNDRLTIKLEGQVSNSKIFDHYRFEEVDVFISISASEGGRPVSMQEAQSCGIPLIATKVGGIKEIVNEKVGLLLNSDPTLNEIANAISWFADNPDEAEEMRQASLENWRDNFNADKNFGEFANNISLI